MFIGDKGRFIMLSQQFVHFLSSVDILSSSSEFSSVSNELQSVLERIERVRKRSGGTRITNTTHWNSTQNISSYYYDWIGIQIGSNSKHIFFLGFIKMNRLQ